MANEFLTLKTIARRALPALMDELVFPALCSRDLNEDFGELGGEHQFVHQRGQRLAGDSLEGYKVVCHYEVSSYILVMDTVHVPSGSF